ncbi:MAG: GFA family protein [Pseudomonadota bacterium]
MYAGSCLCGEIAYTISACAENASHCYCTMCQKQHGAASGSYINVASAAFRYTAGEALVVAYESSPGVTRCFCKRCGSTLTWQMAQHNGRIAVTLGTLDTPFEGEVTREIHPENKPRWTPRAK